jgi:NAD+ synthase
MTTEYNVGQEHKYLVVGTSNRDELHTGYFTKFGDGASDILPISHLSKQQVYEMAKILNVPEKIINKKPSAGLLKNQDDETDMKVTYKELDDYLTNGKATKEVKDRVDELHNLNKHKLEPMARPDNYKKNKDK